MTRLADRARAVPRALLFWLAVAALLRLWFVARWAPMVSPDVHTYARAAEELMSGVLIGSHLVMPGYPLFIGLVGWDAVPWAQALLSTATVALVWGLARRLLGRGVAPWAAALAALEPLSVFYANQRLTETLFLFLLCAALLALSSRRLLLGSVLLVLGILVRPGIELVAPLLVTLFAARGAPRRPRTAALRRAGRAVAIYAGVYLLLMAPWWLHNLHKYDGRFVRLNLGDGIVMRVEHNPLFVEHGFWDGILPVFDEFDDVADPIERNRRQRDAALQFIADDPARYAALSLRRLWRFWSPWMDQDEWFGPPRLRHAVVLPGTLAVYAGVLLYALQRRRRRWRRIAPLLLVIGFLASVHVATHALVRYRAPVMPLLVVIAAAGWKTAVRRTALQPAGGAMHNARLFRPGECDAQQGVVSSVGRRVAAGGHAGLGGDAVARSGVSSVRRSARTRGGVQGEP